MFAREYETVHPVTLAIDPARSLLLTDLYEISMLDAYLQAGIEHLAVFEFFVRRLPPQRAFLMAAGLKQALRFLETAFV